MTKDSGQGLIEAVIALAIIGIVMIGLTSVTLNTLRIARESELEDVATQAIVEAVDYLKAPGDINAYISSGPGITNGQQLRSISAIGNNGGFFRLDDTSNGYRLIPATLSGSSTFILPANGCDSTGANSEYLLKALLDPNDPLNSYYVCIQIYIKPRTTAGYDIYVLGIWESQSLFINNNPAKLNKFEAFRTHEILVNTSGGSVYTQPGCGSACITNGWNNRQKNT